MASLAMARTIVSGSRGLGLSPGRGHCVLFLCRDTWLSQHLSPPRCINSTGDFNARVTLRWTIIPTKEASMTFFLKGNLNYLSHIFRVNTYKYNCFSILVFLSFFVEKKPLKVTLTEGKQRIAVRQPILLSGWLCKTNSLIHTYIVTP